MLSSTLVQRLIRHRMSRRRIGLAMSRSWVCWLLLVGVFVASATALQAYAGQLAAPQRASTLLEAQWADVPSLSGAQTAAAISPATTTTYTGWVGWDGNRAIYPSMYRTPTYLSSATNSSFAYQTKSNTSGSLGVANSAVVTLATTGKNASWYAYQPGGVGSGWILHTFFTGFGASSEYTEAQDEYWIVDYMDASQQIADLPSTTHLDLQTSYNSGINLTQGNTGTGSSGQELSSAMSLAVDVASAAFPPAGFALEPASVLLDLMGTTGGNNCGAVSTNTGPPPSGNETVNQWGQVTFNSYPLSGGWLGFGQSVYVETTIPLTSGGYLPRLGGDGGTVTVGAEDQIGEQPSDTCGFPNQDASSVTVSYPIWPAVSINGTVNLYPGGPVAPDATVLLAQSCPTGVPSLGSADYDLTTNSDGFWQFFADPGCTYTETATGSATYQSGTVTSLPVNIPTATTSLANEGNSTQVPTIFLGSGLVSFTETGLGSGQPGQSWSITLGGATVSVSPGSEIRFLEQNGSYSYTVGALTGYSASPSSGTVTLPGTTFPVSISFKEVSTYSASFSESGLPSGVNWVAEVGNSKQTAAAGSTITFTGLAGDYTYTIPSVLVLVSPTKACQYVPNYASGSVTGQMSLSVTFGRSSICVTT